MKLVKWFDDQLIQKKLLLINGLVIASLLTPILLVMISYEYYALRQATLEAIRVNADIVSDNAATAMAFKDNVTATEALVTLQASTEIQQAFLVLADGDLLAFYQREEGATIQLQREVPQREIIEELTWDEFKLIKPVYLKSEFVGVLELNASLDIFFQRIKLYITIISVTVVISLLISFGLAVKLKNSIIKPLLHLMDSVNRVTTDHDYSVRPMVERNDELGNLSRAFYDMMCKLEERDSQLQGLAFYDSVTSLPNRHFFKERIEQAVNNALRYQQRCCLLFIDLDDFKIVNDTLGHHIGDDLLRTVGKRLHDTLRHNDLVCRIGGDEFAVILENVEKVEISELIAEKIIKTLSQPFTIQGHEVKVGASIGISVCPDLADDTTTLMRTADTAMYIAKGLGKNTFQRYTP
jgi:diguanylate cyclase (GGDEF)-like protein